MKKIKAAIYVYLKSLTSIDYYRSVLSEPTLFTVKYFLAISLVAALSITTYISFKAVPTAKTAFDSFVSKTKELFPEDLVITTKGDSWAINKEEPYIIPFPKIDMPENSSDGTETKTYKNLLVLDHNGTIDDLQKTDTMILINEKNLLSLDTKGTIQVTPLKELPEAKIDKTLVNKGIDKLAELGKFLPAAIVGLIFLGITLYYIVLRVIYLLFLALIIMGIGQLTSLKPNFGTSFRIGVHTMTLPLTVEFLLILTGIEFPFVFWFISANLIFATLVMTKIANPAKPAESKPINETPENGTNN